MLGGCGGGGSGGITGGSGGAGTVAGSGGITGGSGGAAVGTGGGGGSPAVTFWQDVAPIYNEKCVACHQAGGLGPFASTTTRTPCSTPLTNWCRPPATRCRRTSWSTTAAAALSRPTAALTTAREVDHRGLGERRPRRRDARHVDVAPHARAGGRRRRLHPALRAGGPGGSAGRERRVSLLRCSIRPPRRTPFSPATT